METSYRGAISAKIGDLVKPPGIKLEIAKVKRVLSWCSTGWPRPLYTLSTPAPTAAYTTISRMCGICVYDKSGMVAEVKIWLDALTLETALSGEAAKLSRTTAKGKVSEGVGYLRGDTPTSHLRLLAKPSCCQLLISA